MPPLAPFFFVAPLFFFPLLVSAIWWSEMQLYVMGALTWERKDIWQQGSASNRNVCKSISEERGEFGRRRRSSLLKGQCGLYNYPQLTQRDKRSIARAIWLPFRLSIEKKKFTAFSPIKLLTNTQQWLQHKKRESFMEKYILSSKSLMWNCFFFIWPQLIFLCRTFLEFLLELSLGDLVWLQLYISPL